MTKLLKYEIKKTWLTKLIVLGITGVAEIAFLLGLLLKDSKAGEKLIPMSIVTLVMIAFGGVMVIGIQSVLTLHRDMNTKQGYMLFMTPRSSYQIVGAKMLENGISIALSGVFFFALGFLDITLMFARYGELAELWKRIRELLDMFRVEVPITPAGIGAVIFASLASWLATVTIAYLADIISSALLNGKKFNGILTFVLFIALNILMNYMLRALPSGQGITQLVVIGVGSLVFSVIMYIASSILMERYLSV